jgi:hypothetical protein
MLTVTALCAPAARNYGVTAIRLPPGMQTVSIAGINASGQVVGTFSGGPPNQDSSNFLFTPRVGITNIEGTGPPSSSSWEGSAAVAINDSGQILLSSGLLYTPGQSMPQNLALLVAATFPDEPSIRFYGLNNRG